MNGEKIKSYLDNGAKIVVCIVPNKAYTKMTCKYRLFKNEDTFIDITKYQAKQYLDSQTLENISLFEEVKKMMDGNTQFNKRLDYWNKNKENMRVKTMKDCIKELRYTEL